METPPSNPAATLMERSAARFGIAPDRARLWTMMACLLLLGILAMTRFYTYQGHLLHGWDGQFYFAEARGFLFGHTVDVTETLKQTPWPGPFDRNGDGVLERVPLRADGRFQSKYPIGLPMVETAFLAVAYGLRRALEAGGVSLRGPPGLSHFEIWIVALGLFGITMIGLYRLAGLCSDWMGKRAWAWPTALAFVGTTLFYYSAMFPFMTHCLSFTVAVYFMAGLRSLSKGEAPNRNLAVLGALAGLLFLIRPQQALLPLLSLPWLLKPLRGRPGAWMPGAALGALLSLAAIAATLCYNKAQFGIYTLNGYAVAHERFDFLHPDFRYVLIGSERGLLYYTPLVLLAIPGLIAILKKDPASWLLPSVLNALAQIYLVAAWWCPSQGDAFGLRMWTECVPVVAIGMAALPPLRFWRSRPARLVFAAAAAACCLWSGYLLSRYNGWIKGPPLSPEPTCEAGPLPRIAGYSHPGESPRYAR